MRSVSYMSFPGLVAEPQEGNRKKGEVTADEIMAIVAEHFWTSPDEIKLNGTSRKRQFKEVRHVLIFMLRNYCWLWTVELKTQFKKNHQVLYRMPLTNIGRYITGDTRERFDHSTMIHAINRVKANCFRNEPYVNELREIVKKLGMYDEKEFNRLIAD